MTEQPDKRPLGQIAFDAYNAERGGKTHDGKPTPPWEALGDGVRSGWTAGAHAVLKSATFPDRRIGGPDAGPNRHAGQAEQAAWNAKVRDRWMPIIAPDGVIREDLVLAELSDFSHILNEVPSVYAVVTGGKLSEPNYFAHAVLSVYEDEASGEIREGQLEVLLDVADGLDLDEDTLAVLTDVAKRYELGNFVEELDKHRAQQSRFDAIVQSRAAGPGGSAP